jgi:hypothetical protein
MRVQIKSVNGANLYDGEFNDLKTGVTAAVKSNADLRGADLRCMRGRTRKGCHACDRRREIAADPAQADYENAGAAFSDSVI